MSNFLTEMYSSEPKNRTKKITKGKYQKKAERRQKKRSREAAIKDMLAGVGLRNRANTNDIKKARNEVRAQGADPLLTSSTCSDGR
jgi:hypothetical protein